MILFKLNYYLITVSAFRRGRLAEQGIKVEEKEEEKLPQSVEEGVKNLEFFDPKEASNEEGYRHSRLAVVSFNFIYFKIKLISSL